MAIEICNKLPHEIKKVNSFKGFKEKNEIRTQ